MCHSDYVLKGRHTFYGNVDLLYFHKTPKKYICFAQRYREFPLLLTQCHVKPEQGMSDSADKPCQTSKLEISTKKYVTWINRKFVWFTVAWKKNM